MALGVQPAADTWNAPWHHTQGRRHTHAAWYPVPLIRSQSLLSLEQEL